MTTRRTLAGKSVFSLFLLSLFTGIPAGFAGLGNERPGYRVQEPDSPRRVVYGMTADQSRQHPATIGETFRHAIPESREMASDILPWNWDSYGVALGISAATLPLVLTRNEIQETIGLDKKEPGGDIPMGEISFVDSDGFYTQFEFLGEKLTLPALSGAFVLGGLLLKSQREVETGLMLVESLVFTAAVTGLGQFVLAEERPYQGGELRFFRTHGHGVSGHSSISASMVRPLDSQYLRIGKNDGRPMVIAKYLGKGILYSAPVMVAVSRVRSNRHYLWNVVLGLGAGYSVGKVVADVHEKSEGAAEAETGSWRIFMGIEGVSLSFGW